MSSTATDSALLKFFEPEIAESGRVEYRRRKVLSLSWQDDVYLSARVTGSGGRLLDVEIHFHHPKKDICCTECTCAQGGDCKHAAAAVLAFLEDPGSVKSAPKTAPIKSPIKRTQTPFGGTLPDLDSLASGLDVMSLRIGNRRQLDYGEPLPEKWKVSQDVEKTMRSFSRECIDLEPVRSVDDTKNRIAYILGSYSTYKIPTIAFQDVSLKKDGSLGRTREVHLSWSEILPSSATDVDQEIVAQWRSLISWHASISANGKRLSNEFKQAFSFWMATMLQTQRCYFGYMEDNNPISLGPELPAKLEWKNGPDGIELDLIIAGGEDRYRLFNWCYPWYHDCLANTIGPLLTDLTPNQLQLLLTMRPIKQDEAIGLTLLLADLKLSDLVPTPPHSQDLEIQFVNVKPRLVVTSLGTAGSSESLKCLLLSFPPSAATDKIFREENGKVVVRKQTSTDNEALLARICSLNFVNVNDRIEAVASNDYYLLPATKSTWASLDRATIENLRSAGIDVAKETEKALTPVHISDSKIQIAVKSEDSSWWFALEILIDVEGKKVPLAPILRTAMASLPQVNAESIESLNRSGKFVALLEDESLISMPFDRIKTILNALSELFTDQGKDLRASSLHAAQLLEDGNLSKANWQGSAKITQFVAQLKRLREPRPALKIPANFKATLRPYQLVGVDWLQTIARCNLGGILADDMGLGKTVQLIAHVCLEKENGAMKSPILVICPTSVLPNWIAEITKFAPHLVHTSYTGVNRADLISNFQTSDVVFTTYGLLLRDYKILKEIHWHGLALDEAQAIKNPSSKIAQFAKQLKANHRFCLTGTPVENHLEELWSEFDFIMPGILGTRTHFNRTVRTPIEKQGNSLTQAAFAGRIRPFVLRRTKQEVLKDLPPKTEIIKRVELSHAQLDLYETIRVSCTEQLQKEFARKGFKKSQLAILDALLKLRQVCCHPALMNLPAAQAVKESAKLEMLLEMIAQLTSEGRKILVFSQFTKMLDLIASQLLSMQISYVELRGDTKDRITPVHRFQNTDVPVFLLSLKAGGVGLNLVAADVVIHYDPWWNPAVENQATDRAYRIGQDKHVFVYKLIGNCTIEETMLKMQERKRELADSIYDERGNLGGAFSEEDLLDLMKPLGP